MPLLISLLSTHQILISFFLLFECVSPTILWIPPSHSPIFLFLNCSFISFSFSLFGLLRFKVKLKPFCRSSSLSFLPHVFFFHFLKVPLILSSILPFLHSAIHLPSSNPLHFTSPSVSICSPSLFPFFLLPSLRVPRSPHGEEVFAASASLLLIPPLFPSRSLPGPKGFFRFSSPSFLLRPHRLCPLP